MWWMFYPFITTIREKDINDDFVIPENRDEQHRHHMVCGAIAIACIAIDLALVIAMFANLLSVTDGLWGYINNIHSRCAQLVIHYVIVTTVPQFAKSLQLIANHDNPQPHRRRNLWGYCFPHATLHCQ